MIGRCLLLALCVFGTARSHAEAKADEWRTSVADLYSAEEARDIAATMPIDRIVNFRVRVPKSTGPVGVLVFVKPTADGNFSSSWVELLEQRNLIWISADDFGNTRPSAQRVVMALMAVKLAATLATLDPHRTYVAGMSGGGRIASQLITRFPKKFSGAIFIVGADFWMPDEPVKSLVSVRPMVFITGNRDFNHREMRGVFARYQAAGVQRAKLMDLPGFGHQYPTAAQLGEALDFLEAP